MLDRKSSALTRREAGHLLCRATFSASLERTEAAVGRSAEEVVRGWIEAPQASWFLLDPPWLATPYPPTGAPDEEVQAFRDANAYYVREVRSEWMREIIQGGLRDRVALFWHNHFVTDVRKYYYGSLAFRYVRLIRSFAFGNFKRFVKAMTTEGAMLYYLDGRFNTRAAPNENYARELMELFTMGPTSRDGSPNYTQADIREAARALTGWRMNVRESWRPTRRSWAYDSGQKTIYGRTGHFDSDDLVDLIFEERGTEVAQFVCRAFLRAFVHHEPEEAAVDALADRFIASDWEISELLVALLGSEYFFDSRFAGVRVKDPIEMMALQFSFADEPVSTAMAANAMGMAENLGQTLLAPPNVAGWPGHRAWLNTDLLPKRWSASDWSAAFSLTRQQWEHKVQEFTSSSSHPAVDFALGLAEQLLAVPLEHVSVPDLSGPFAGDLAGAPLPDGLLNGPAHERNLVKMFLGEVPWYEWDPASPAGIAMITNFVRALGRLPEFQLS